MYFLDIKNVWRYGGSELAMDLLHVNLGEKFKTKQERINAHKDSTKEWMGRYNSKYSPKIVSAWSPHSIPCGPMAKISHMESAIKE